MRPLLCLASLLLACQLLPAPKPMATTLDRQPGPAPARCLVVLLPGAGDRMDKFSEEGFVTAIRRSGASADIVSVDATLGYYFKGILAARLEQDVLAPARARGHTHVWIFGISMGGFGSLHYTQQHPHGVEGVATFAPYLGASKLGDEIRRAGGLARWTPDPPAPITRKNYQRQLWSWLHRVTTGKEKGPPIYLAYGDDDRLGPQDAVLAAALPADHVYHAPGGHDWPVWRDLLEQFLARSEFTARCAAPTSTPAS